MKQVTINPLCKERKIKIMLGDGIEAVYITDRDDNILYRMDDDVVPCEQFIDKIETNEYTV